MTNRKSSMLSEIRKEGDPILRQATEKVTDFGFEFQKLVDDMVETMRATGVGLAAPQIGLAKKVFVAEFVPKDENESKLAGFALTVLCNPKIIKSSRRQRSMVEGCLSVPGREVLIKRPEKITVSGQDRYGKNIIIQAEDFHARALQHEMDHLNGVLIVDHMQVIDLVFIGTGSLGLPSLEALIKDPQYKIKAVVTGKATALVRGKKVDQNEIYALAKKSNLSIIKTEKIGDEEIVKQLAKLKSTLGVMADFGQILPESVLKIPKLGIINIHPSLLPKFRGPSPIQSTLLEGEEKAGVTLIKTALKMDVGGVIAQVIVELSGSETSTILKDYLAKVGAALLLETLPYYAAGDLEPVPQDENQATYTKMFEKDDGFVTAFTPKEEVERKIRAFDTWPKVYTLINDKRIFLLAAHYNEAGELVIDRVKPEGKKEMGYDDFRRGYHQELTFR